MLTKSLLLIFLLAASVSLENRTGYAHDNAPDVFMCGNVYYYLMKSTHCISTYYALAGDDMATEYYTL